MTRVGDLYYCLGVLSPIAEVTRVPDGHYDDANIEIPETITFNDKEYLVRYIGESAFNGCKDIVFLTIPNSVVYIGISAFNGCSNLFSVNIPNNVTSIENYTFYGCSSLATITIPDKVTSIGYYAFSECSSLTSVSIPNSVTDIRDGAFYNCSGLISVTIPVGVTSIENSVFYGCSGLSSVTIPDGVTSIGNAAFSGCSGLTSVTIPNGVTSIGNSAFYGCGITTLTIPEGVTSIGSSAFYICGSLTSVSLPNSLTSIGESAFCWCTKLISVTLPSSLTSISESLFSQCNGLVSVFIPNSVTSIGEHAFSNCSSLITMNIPNSVTSIDEGAFVWCTRMETLKLSDALRVIKKSAFYGCYNLKSITIPAAVEYIYAEAFGNCNALESIKALPENPPFINDNTFSNYSVPLIVPQGCKEAYQSAQGWKNFTDISDSRYKLTYMVDGEEYKSYIIESGTAITPEPEPTKDTYKFSGWSEIPETMPNHDVVITGTFERYFDVGHLAKVINFVMKSNASASDVTLFDLNNDEELNIGDVILIVRNILNHDTNSAAAIGRRAGDVIDLTQYTAAQFEVKMADGKEIKLVSSMAMTHQLMYQQKDENTYSVVVFSLSNQLMSPENGNIIEMDGAEDAIENVVLAKPNGETDCYQSLPVSTGIQQIENGTSSAVIYDLKGNRLNDAKALDKGIYIVNGKKTVVR